LQPLVQPNAICRSKKGPKYRYLAKREAMAEQLELPRMEQQLELKGKRYKVFGMVTNPVLSGAEGMDWDGEELIRW
jgi:hypothetical protein